MYSLAPQQVSYSQVNITMFTELPPPFHGHWSLITWALMSSGGTYSNMPMSGVLEQVSFIFLNHSLRYTKGYCSSSASLDFTLLRQSLSYGENTSALNDTRQSSSQHPPAKLKNIRYKQYDDLPVLTTLVPFLLESFLIVTTSPNQTFGLSRYRPGSFIL